MKGSFMKRITKVEGATIRKNAKRDKVLADKKEREALAAFDASALRDAMKEKAPFHLKEYVEQIFDQTSLKSNDDLMELLDDSDAMIEMADAVDVYTSKLVAWYAEDANRLNYVNDAVKEGLADLSPSTFDMDKLLMLGQYKYNEECLAEAADFIKEEMSSAPTEEEPTEEAPEESKKD